MQGVPEFMGQTLKVSEIYIKKHFLHSYVGLKMENTDGKPRNTREMKKVHYLCNITVIAQMCLYQH